MSETRHRYGDVREDGRVFIGYVKTCKGGEYWVTPDRFALLRLNAKLRYYEKQAADDGSSKRIGTTVKTNPNLRVRKYAPRLSRRKPELTPTQIDALPYGPNLNPESGDLNLTRLPNYPKYAITPQGTVHRLGTAKRGKTAYINNPRVKPHLTRYGRQWCVMLDNGGRSYERVAIADLMEQVYGHQTQTNS